MVRIQKTNQSGAAMIMFAMIMMIVLSLIAIGFAFLVRNDQRQTLDKTLSNQAVYAAESAINRKAKQLKDGTEATTVYNGCGTPAPLDSSAPEVQITCLNWDAEPEVLSINNIDESPKSVLIKPSASSGNVQYFAVRWKAKDACDSATTWGQFLDTLDGANACPYLKVSMSAASQVYSGRGSVVYSRAQSDISAVPTNSSGNTFSYTQENGGTAPTYTSAAYANQSFSNPSGEIDNTFCNGGYCLVRIKVPSGGNWSNANTGLVSFSAIGGQVDIEISAYTTPLNLATETLNFFPSAATPPVLWAAPGRAKLVGAQAIVDATAKANDVIRRVRVSVPIGSDTWVPGFAINANTICKNYRVNATGNTTAGPANGTVCY